ncbi:hypothetical protein EV06_0465 [Prochlorococcus sp. MIT 0602]|uniref:hypothetical protein n=2 Tax=unclassified Prochlorococcus TaxID=2627481 RepID=UPI000533BC09|nr:MULTISPECIES: hypothetical protein [unclassified Prochlorococcus]KGG16623.1 hypothetical protein EV06_0465 [Prochlorococcus sp. MIT 0602]KGG18405.1 hypothetical protein EV07_0321 [Prochlorococcus sp. MIT 0603]
MKASQKELNDSIEELRNYSNRLTKEITTMSQKLRISKEKIQASINENLELKNIAEAIKVLINEQKKISNPNNNLGANQDLTDS